jgi:primary-amine oxidase
METEIFAIGSILPLGLYFKTDMTGRDPSKWKLEGWYYNGEFYATSEAFRTAYYSPGFEKLPLNVDGAWAWTDRQGELPMDGKPPP